MQVWKCIYFLLSISAVSPFVDFVCRLMPGGFIALMMPISNLQSLLIPAALAQELLPNTRPGGFGGRSWRDGGGRMGRAHASMCQGCL